MTRSGTVAEPASGNLEQCVANGKDAKDVAHHLVVEPRDVALDIVLGCGNAHAIHVRVDGMQKQQKYQPESLSRRNRHLRRR
jgi:hypothetical protein